MYIEQVRCARLGGFHDGLLYVRHAMTICCWRHPADGVLVTCTAMEYPVLTGLGTLGILRDSETAAAAERAVATWQARVAEKEKAYMRQLRIVVTRWARAIRPRAFSGTPSFVFLAAHRRPWLQLISRHGCVGTCGAGSWTRRYSGKRRRWPIWCVSHGQGCYLRSLLTAFWICGPL